MVAPRLPVVPPDYMIVPGFYPLKKDFFGNMTEEQIKEYHGYQMVLMSGNSWKDKNTPFYQALQVQKKQISDFLSMKLQKETAHQVGKILNYEAKPGDEQGPLVSKSLALSVHAIATPLGNLISNSARLCHTQEKLVSETLAELFLQTQDTKKREIIGKIQDIMKDVCNLNKVAMDCTWDKDEKVDVQKKENSWDDDLSGDVHYGLTCVASGVEQMTIFLERARFYEDCEMMIPPDSIHELHGDSDDAQLVKARKGLMNLSFQVAKDYMEKKGFKPLSAADLTGGSDERVDNDPIETTRKIQELTKVINGLKKSLPVKARPPPKKAPAVQQVSTPVASAPAQSVSTTGNTGVMRTSNSLGPNKPVSTFDEDACVSDDENGDTGNNEQSQSALAHKPDASKKRKPTSDDEDEEMQPVNEKELRKSIKLTKEATERAAREEAEARAKDAREEAVANAKKAQTSKSKAAGRGRGRGKK